MFAALVFFGGPGYFEWLVLGAIIVVPVLVLTVLPFWVIFEKAGFPGALSLLMTVPGINLVVLFFFAFTQWPALKQRGQGKNIGSPGPAPEQQSGRS
ncbi:MAG: hypothetical protein JW719_01660 [Pirellulales bacterium]|nr:hypothetical protein [Pirellulales bacterium]